VAGRRLATSRLASLNRSGVVAGSSDICRARRDSPGARSASGAGYADAPDAAAGGRAEAGAALAKAATAQIGVAIAVIPGEAPVLV
jgi:hypothetical protein